MDVGEGRGRPANDDDDDNQRCTTKGALPTPFAISGELPMIKDGNRGGDVVDDRRVDDGV